MQLDICMLHTHDHAHECTTKNARPLPRTAAPHTLIRILSPLFLFSFSSVVLNHTVSAGQTHGVMHHFWATGAEHVIDEIRKCLK